MPGVSGDWNPKVSGLYTEMDRIFIRPKTLNTATCPKNYFGKYFYGCNNNINIDFVSKCRQHDWDCIASVLRFSNLQCHLLYHAADRTTVYPIYHHIEAKIHNSFAKSFSRNIPSAASSKFVIVHKKRRVWFFKERKNFFFQSILPDQWVFKRRLLLLRTALVLWIMMILSSSAHSWWGLKLSYHRVTTKIKSNGYRVLVHIRIVGSGKMPANSLGKVTSKVNHLRKGKHFVIIRSKYKTEACTGD